MRAIDADALTPDTDYDDGDFWAFSKTQIENAPTIESEQRWIPISERLSEKCGWYMCTLKDYRVNTYYWNNKGEWIDNGKKHFFELYNISSRYTGEDITAEQEGSVYWTDWVIAWMPLPDPYKKGSGGK